MRVFLRATSQVHASAAAHGRSDDEVEGLKELETVDQRCRRFDVQRGQMRGWPSISG